MKINNKLAFKGLLIISMMLVMVVAPSITSVMAVKPTGCLDGLGVEGVDYEINYDYLGSQEHHPDCLIQDSKDFNCWNCRKGGCPVLAISISVDFDYNTDDYFTNEPISGMEYWLFDGSDILLTSGITDSTGAFSYIIKEMINDVGIHVVFNIKDGNYTRNDLIIGANNFDWSGFGISADFVWSDDLTPAQVGAVELWYDGSLIDTFNLQGINANTFSATSYNLPAGTYTFKGTMFDDVSITIDLLGLEIYSIPIEIDAEGIIGA